MDDVMMDGERTLAISYAPKTSRSALLALWKLDESLGRIVASTTDLTIGQMRLSWWHERLTALDAGERVAEPLLRNVLQDVLPHNVTGGELAELIEGWEALLEPFPMKEPTLTVFAEKRGGALFRFSARLLAGLEGPDDAGEGWALVDFATRCTNAETVALALAMARNRFANLKQNGPKTLRILTRLAQAKAARPVETIRNPLPRFVSLRAVLG